MSYTVETIELPEHPNLRARIVADDDPSAPEFEAGYPVIRLDGGRSSTRTAGHVYGQEVAGMEDALDRFLANTNDGLETFTRYLRIFHDGDAVVIKRPGWNEYGYVVYGTRSLLDSWGCTPDAEVKPEAEEWEAYIEGDVYGIIVEQAGTETTEFRSHSGELVRRSEVEEWEEIESVWGFYDRDVWSASSYTLTEARTMIEANA